MEVTYLASCINDFSSKLGSLVLDNFAECVFNGGVITLNKMPIDKLYRE